jgi:hypothetical protein
LWVQVLPPLPFNICPSGGMVDAWGLRSHSIVCAGSNPALGTKLGWFCGVVINTPPCHGGDREFDSRQDRHLYCHLMIRIKINKEKTSESSFLFFKKLSSFALRKYRKGLYFEKKKRK